MIKRKTYKGNLNIGEHIVSIDTDIEFQGIEIEYVGSMTIISLLSSDYLVKIGGNKIIIVKMSLNEEKITDLFQYKGVAMISRCRIITPEFESIKMSINKLILQLWNTLMKTQRTETGGAGTEQDWAYLGENWEDIDFDGKNNKKYYTYRKTTYDEDAKTYTTTKEIRKK